MRQRQLSNLLRRRRVLLAGSRGEVADHLYRALVRRGAAVTRFDLTAFSERGPDADPDAAPLDDVLRNVHTVYYLPRRELALGDDPADDPRTAAEFVLAARRARVRRVIHLGALGHGELSPGTARRQAIGRLLRDSGIPTLEFQMSTVIGPQSDSLALLRVWAARGPRAARPAWMYTRRQPLALADLLGYLIEAWRLPCVATRVYEIGGPELASYSRLLDEYLRQHALDALSPTAARRGWNGGPWALPTRSSLFASIPGEFISLASVPAIVHDQRALRVFRVAPRAVHRMITDALVPSAEMAPPISGDHGVRAKSASAGAPGWHRATRAAAEWVFSSAKSWSKPWHPPCNLLGQT